MGSLSAPDLPAAPAKPATCNWWWNPHAPARPTHHHPRAPFNLLDFLMRYRWLVIIPIVLPLSFLWARLHRLRAFLALLRRDPPTSHTHAARVARVQAAVRARGDAGAMICTARPSFWSISTRDSAYKKGRRFEVDLADLADVFDVDLDAMTVCLEPYANMGQLTSTLLAKGVCVPVVPEYDDLTVGGLVCGYGIEGSSHKYGLFYDEVISMEVVLASGEVVTATRDNEHKELFHAIPWSYGALGMLVGVKMRLIRVKPYMKVTYYPVAGTMQQIAEAWKQFLVPESRPWAEYVEGLVFSSTRAVVLTADYVDAEEAEAPGTRMNRMGMWYKPWYHRYVKEEVLEKTVDGAPVVEYVPTRDFYHRHTRSLYWEMDLLVPMGNHWLFRLLLGWLMPARVSFLKLTMFGKMQEYYNSRFVAQDILVPLHKTAECMELMHDEYDIYPLWLCPHRVFKTRMGTMLDCEDGYDEGELAQGDTPEAQMFTDLGIWYTPGHILRGEKFNAAEASHKLEQWLIRNHGYQTLYAITELSEADFWTMFDRTLYQKCREKYNAIGNFMDVYYKVGKKNSSASAKAKNV